MYIKMQFKFMECPVILVICAATVILTDVTAMSHYRHSHNSKYNHDRNQFNSSAPMAINNVLPTAPPLSLSTSMSPMQSENNTTKSLKLTLINSYSSDHDRIGFGGGHHSNTHRWNGDKWWIRTTTTTTTTTSTTVPPPLQSTERLPVAIDNSSPSVAIPSSINTDVPRSIKDRLYTKHHAGRHVCVEYKTITMPISDTNGKDIYTSNSIINHSSNNQLDDPCHNQRHCNNRHHSVYKDPGTHRVTKQTILSCCPGWTQVSKNSHGCIKPICKQPCLNGGKCVKPETCSCLPGFIGNYCEIDRNECRDDKPCDQYCYNTEGSYYCACRKGFQLQSDRQSCKKMGGDAALEARDMENDVDNDDVHVKMNQIEKFVLNEKERTNQIQKMAENTAIAISQIKMKIVNLEQQNKELANIQERLKNQEEYNLSLSHRVNLLINCRKNPSMLMCLFL